MGTNGHFKLSLNDEKTVPVVKSKETSACKKKLTSVFASELKLVEVSYVLVTSTFTRLLHISVTTFCQFIIMTHKP